LSRISLSSDVRQVEELAALELLGVDPEGDAMELQRRGPPPVTCTRRAANALAPSSERASITTTMSSSSPKFFAISRSASRKLAFWGRTSRPEVLKLSACSV